MTPITQEDLTRLSVEVIVSEEEPSVYIKLSGFDNLEDADNYADYLTDALPLLLFQTKVIQ